MVSLHPRLLPGHTAEVNDLSFGLDGRVLISVSNNKTARVWQTNAEPEKRGGAPP